MMKSSSLARLDFCFLFVLSGCLGQIEQGVGWKTQQQQQQSRRYQGRSQCRIENINAQEPNRRVESEAGVTELWDHNNEQFECAGVAPARYIIQPNGLLLPFFVNAPRLVYIVQGYLLPCWCQFDLHREKLLTTPNNDFNTDQMMFKVLGLTPKAPDFDQKATSFEAERCEKEATAS